MMTSNYKFNRYQNVFLIDKINEYFKNRIINTLNMYDVFASLNNFKETFDKLIEAQRHGITMEQESITKLKKYCKFLSNTGVQLSAAIFDYYALVRISKILYNYPNNTNGKNIVICAGSRHIENIINMDKQ